MLHRKSEKFDSELEVEYATQEVRKDDWDMDYIFNYYMEEYEIEPVYKKRL